MNARASPTGIAPWIWLPLLSFFMLFILWLCLRNASQLLPIRVQYKLQHLADNLVGRGRIRLLDTPGIYNTDDRSHRSQFTLDLDGSSSEDDDDDELPLATVGEPYNGKGGRRKLERIANLFGGISHQSNRYRQANLDAEEQPERIVDLPITHSNRSVYAPSNRSSHRASGSASTSLFRTDSAEMDAPTLPPHFSLPSSPTIPPQSPFERTSSFNHLRSPTRSPALSRTPSLVAIQEETSASPRSSIDKSTYPAISSHSMARDYSSSSASSEQELPDWASAKTSTSHIKGSDIRQTMAMSHRTSDHSDRMDKDLRFTIGAGIRRTSDRSAQDLKSFAKAVQGF